MKKYLLLSFIFLAGSVFAQSNEQAFDWAMHTGANSNNVNGLNYDSQGNLYVLSSISDSADFGGNIVTAPAISGFPSFNHFVARRNINGTSEVLFQTRGTINNPFSEFTKIAVDPNDDILVVGSTSGGHDFGNGVSLVGRGYFIAKYSKAGVAQWAKMYNFGNPNQSSFTTDAWRIQCLPNGTIIGLIAEFSGKYALINLSSNGTETLYKEFNFTSKGALPFIVSSKNNFFTDASGAFYFCINGVDANANPKIIWNNLVSGTSVAADSIVINNAGHPAVSYLFAFRKDGTKKYFKGFRGSIVDLAVEQSTGNLLFYWKQYGGQNNVAPMDNITGNASGNFGDIFSGIIAVDSQCNFIKKSTEVIAQQYELESLLPLGDLKLLGTYKYNNLGAPIVAGNQSFSVSSGGFFTWFEYNSDLQPSYFIAAPLYSENGSIGSQYMSVYGNKAAVGLSWLASAQSSLNIDGTALVANDKNRSYTTRYNPPFNMPGYDIAFGQFDRTLQNNPIGFNHGKEESSMFVMYPNPSTDVVHVSMKELEVESLIQVSVFDLMGKEVLFQEGQGVQEVSVKSLAKGIYMVKISHAGVTSTQKLSIQ